MPIDDIFDLTNSDNNFIDSIKTYIGHESRGRNNKKSGRYYESINY